MYPKTKQLIFDYLKQGVYPGVAFGFLKEDTLTTYRAGYAQLLPSKEAIQHDTLFDLASLTKVIATNSLILQLLERKQLDLDQPLASYLPEFQDAQVTIRHLLTHTSDINPYIENRHLLKADELRTALLNLRGGANIGQVVAYTDTGTLLLGFLLENYFQDNFQRICQQSVLTPLGMLNSTFSPTNQHIAATELHGTRGLIRGQVHDPKAFVLGPHCGSAGLFASLDDCLIFCQMILAGGVTKQGSRFLKTETIESLFSDQTPTQNLKRSLGWDLLTGQHEESPLLFHTGYTGTFIIIDKDAHEAFVFLSNRVHPSDHRLHYLAKRDHIVELYLKEKAQSF